MPQLRRTDAIRRNIRETTTSRPAAKPPRLRDAAEHHPETRRFWAAVCKAPQSGLFGPATWEWLQAKMWRFDAFYADPINAPSALARELDEISSKLILLPRDAVARGFTPESQALPDATAPRGAARGRRSRSQQLLTIVDDAT